MDAVVAVIAVLLFLISFWRIGWWKWFWIGLAIYLGLFELASVLVTHHTISQQFWIWMDAHPRGGWIACGMIILGGVALAYHLACKQLRRKR